MMSRESRQLATLETKPTKVGDKIEFTYTRKDGDSPKSGQKAGQLMSLMSDALKTQLKTLDVGSEVVVVKTESEANAKGVSYWNLSAIEDAATFVAKPKSTWAGGNKSGYQKKEYDDTGVKVGAARNQAIAFLSATMGNKYTLDDVDTIAYEIVERQAAMESNIRNKTKQGAIEVTVLTNAGVKDDDFDWG